MKKLFVLITAATLCSTSVAEDKWWESTPEYQRCYGKVTQAHKANGLHDRNRAMSIKIKEQICKDAVISKGASGGHWLR